jgi:hypothetical protein
VGAVGGGSAEFPDRRRGRYGKKLVQEHRTLPLEGLLLLEHGFVLVNSAGTSHLKLLFKGSAGGTAEKPHFILLNSPKRGKQRLCGSDLWPRRARSRAGVPS